jgi:hypothetical protein
MAIRGQKPTATILRLAAGNPGKRPIAAGEPEPGGVIERPDKLKGKPGALWDRFIARCHWLTWADGPKALMWCHMQAQFERDPDGMIAGRISQLRALGSELGLDPSSRARLGTKGADGNEKDPASKYGL